MSDEDSLSLPGDSDRRENAEMEFILNRPISYERVRAAAKKLPFKEQVAVYCQRELTKVRVGAFIAVIFICALCFFVSHALFIFVAYVLLIGISLVGIPHKPFPTSLCLGGDSLKLRWRTTRQYDSPQFFLSQVKSARIVELPQFASKQINAGRSLQLSFDPRALSMKQRFWLSLRGRALGHVLLSPMGLLGRFEAFELIIPLDAFTRESDQEVCADALIKRLEPHKVLDSLQSSPHQGTPSFTRLWLDEAQSFRRKSIEPLDTGVELQGGRYRILERVATGGQATVYRAIETTTSPERTVVLKEFVLPVGAGVSVRSRSFDSVKNEALLLSSLKDPGIIEIYDNFVEDHRAYLVLENISGITLRHLVLSEGPLDEKEARSVAVQVSNVLRYLHGRTPPVVHRDLTPDNLIRTPEGNIKLLDFNVALQSESNTTKTVVGKHNYIPPEQFRGMPSPQSDLYSLGATLFFLLTGKDPDALCQSSLEKAGVNSMLESVVSKLTEQELTARYQSVDAVLDDLNALSA